MDLFGDIIGIGLQTGVVFVVIYFAWDCIIGCGGHHRSKQSMHVNDKGDLSMYWDGGSLYWRFGRESPSVHGDGATWAKVGNIARISVAKGSQRQNIEHVYKRAG